MSQLAAGASGLVRVTVASGTRRVDLVLPAAVPVAELVPELARSVGLLDASTVYGGYRVVAQDGRRLSPDAGLTMQGVEDGGLLTVSAGVDEEAPRVYDDVVEAMADVVERDLRPWDPASGRRTALSAAALLLGLGAVSLFMQDGSLLAGVAASVISLLLVSGAVVLSRAQEEPEAAVALAWTASLYAAVAGLLIAPEGDFFTMPLVWAGGAALLAGLVALIGLGAGRALVLPPVVVGAIALVTGLLMDLLDDADPTVVLPVTLVLVVIAGSVLPWVALGVTGTNVEQIYTVADITNDPDEVDARQVGADARTAHEILVSVSATVGLLLVLITPLAVSRGLSGTLMALCCCVVVMLRTRQYRTGSEVLVGLVSGIAGLVSAGLSVLWLQPDWRPTAAVVLAAAGAVLLTATLIPGTPSVRRGRLGDVAETVALLALLPLLLVAVGVVSQVGS